jgi:hypothetical protein
MGRSTLWCLFSSNHDSNRRMLSGKLDRNKIFKMERILLLLVYLEQGLSSHTVVVGSRPKSQNASSTTKKCGNH